MTPTAADSAAAARTRAELLGELGAGGATASGWQVLTPGIATDGALAERL